MKKTTAVILALVLALSLGACGAKPQPAPSTPPAAEQPAEPEKEPAEDNTEAEEPGEEEFEEPALPEIPEGETVATIMNGKFKDLVNKDAAYSCEELAELLSTDEFLPFGAGYMQVEEGYLAGFDEEIDGFEEGFMFGPYIGSIPFVGYVFRLADEATATEFAEKIAAVSNPRWNVCTSADETIWSTSGDKVFFLMCPATWEE